MQVAPETAASLLALKPFSPCSLIISPSPSPSPNPTLTLTLALTLTLTLTLKVATVGKTEEDLKAAGTAYKVGKLPFL